MPRQARIDAPGALHHIIIRGIDRKLIFRNEADFEGFQERLGKILLESNTPCYAWALMPNHIHLLLRTGLISIATLMRRLLTGYAQQFNRRHQRSGHLFQNRYKSILCEEELYLLELIRYIHLNPLRANVVKDLAALSTFKNTGHAVLLGNIEFAWQDTDFILGRFGNSTRSAKEAYVDFIAEETNKGQKPELVGGGLVRSVGGWKELKKIRSGGNQVKGDERILGGIDFVERVLKQANEEYHQHGRLLKKGHTLETLLNLICKFFKVDKEIVRSASKHRSASRAKSVLCWLAVGKLKMSCKDTADYLTITPSAVSRLAYRGRQDPELAQIEKIIFVD